MGGDGQVVVRIAFGLGNQMFEYAAADRLSTDTGRGLRLDLGEFFISRFFRCPWPRRFLLDNFPALVPIPRLGWFRRVGYLLLWVARKLLGVRAFGRLVTLLGIHWIDHWAGRTLNAGSDNARTVFLSGVPTELSLLPSRSRIRQLFRFSDAPAFPAAAGESVGIHVRRTDFGAAALSADYYRGAFSALVAKHPSARAVFFSDDVEWCRREFGDLDGAVFVDGDIDNPVEDLRKFASCRHHILSNSTFSWWGACLAAADGENVFPPGELGIPRTFPR